MLHHLVTKIIISSFLFFSSPTAFADNKAMLENAWEYIVNKECDSARELFTLPLSSAEVKCIYGKSVCCSDTDKLKNKDVGVALDYLNEASETLGGSDQYISQWIEDAKKQCREVSTSLSDNTRLSHAAMMTERESRSEVWSHYKGKATSGCQQDNLSPVLIPDESPSVTSLWHYVAPRFGDSTDLVPSDDYLKDVLADYVDDDKPAYKICAPFIAISATQDPQKICNAAHKFTDYFVSTYKASRPPTWITLYHYPQHGGKLKEHAEGTTGKIHCENVLGFFDWRRQSIVFKAPNNFFGTFQHELTHALMFWDMPMAPRWFEEGLAAMYENTDKNYQSLENPWREKVLDKNNISEITLSVFSDEVLSRSDLEFEAQPVGATISREVMRKLQQCGDLPGLYKALKGQYQNIDILHAYRTEPHEPPVSNVIQSWQAKLIQYSKMHDSEQSCLY